MGNKFAVRDTPKNTLAAFSCIGFVSAMFLVFSFYLFGKKNLLFFCSTAVIEKFRDLKTLAFSSNENAQNYYFSCSFCHPSSLRIFHRYTIHMVVEQFVSFHI